MFRGSKSIKFNSVNDIPPLKGKVILVTGGNIGLGKQSVLEFARHDPAQIWLAARNIEKAKTALDEIKKDIPNAAIKLLELDLSDFGSIQKAATAFSAQSDRLDILMLNAGIMAHAPGLTKDGYEVQFGTNHMGHALLTKLLLPMLNRTAKISPNPDIRVISLSSYGHRFAPKEGIKFDALKTSGDDLGAYDRYGQSKLANILWIRHLAKQYPQFTVAAVHPGVVNTNLSAGAIDSSFGMRLLLMALIPFGDSLEKGAQNQLWASVSHDVKSGEYYEPVGVADKGAPIGKDDELAKSLWQWTEKELANYPS